MQGVYREEMVDPLRPRTRPAEGKSSKCDKWNNNNKDATVWWLSLLLAGSGAWKLGAAAFVEMIIRLGDKQLVCDIDVCILEAESHQVVVDEPQIKCP